MSGVTDRISALGIMPVITSMESVEDCDLLANALCEGGIPAMEITFRMDCAQRCIRRARDAFPQMLVGAGTVVTMEQAEQAIEAGAQFLVAPGLNPEIVRFCQSKNVEIIPGVCTPSEVERAMGMGLKCVKFFPAEQSGGVAAIKAICGPYRGIDFMPTGGVGLNNLADYFALDRVIACGGTFMLDNHLAKREWTQITELCRRSVQTMLGLKIAHVGVNTPNAETACKTAGLLAGLLRLDMGGEGGSIFVGNAIEVMKSVGMGANGHIALATISVDRSVRYLRAMGVEFDEQTAKYAPNSHKLRSIYFKQEFGGFAIHLVNA